MFLISNHHGHFRVLRKNFTLPDTKKNQVLCFHSGTIFHFLAGTYSLKKTRVHQRKHTLLSLVLLSFAKHSGYITGSSRVSRRMHPISLSVCSSRRSNITFAAVEKLRKSYSTMANHRCTAQALTLYIPSILRSIITIWAWSLYPRPYTGMSSFQDISISPYESCKLISRRRSPIKSVFP